MDWEKNDYFDIVCPHGVVTHRLSRIKDLNLPESKKNNSCSISR